MGPLLRSCVEVHEDLLTMHLPIKFHYPMFNRSEFIVLTNKHTTDSAETSTLLHYATPVENHWTKAVKVKEISCKNQGNHRHQTSPLTTCHPSQWRMYRLLSYHGACCGNKQYVCYISAAALNPCCPLVNHFEFILIIFAWPITNKHDIIHKTGSTQQIAMPSGKD